MQTAASTVGRIKDNIPNGLETVSLHSRYSQGTNQDHLPLHFKTRPETKSFKDDLQLLINDLKVLGFNEAYYIDLTGEGPEIPVVFTLVPGMRYTWV